MCDGYFVSPVDKLDMERVMNIAYVVVVVVLIAGADQEIAGRSDELPQQSCVRAMDLLFAWHGTPSRLCAGPSCFICSGVCVFARSPSCPVLKLFAP